MADWPTLSSGIATPYSKIPVEGNDLSSKSEGGYKARRLKYSKERFQYSFSLRGMSDTDKDLLEDFVALKGTSTSFTWDNEASQTQTVCFAKRPTFTLDKGLWSANILLEDV